MDKILIAIFCLLSGYSFGKYNSKEVLTDTWKKIVPHRKIKVFPFKQNLSAEEETFKNVENLFQKKENPNENFFVY